jgi:hypothetical protein
MMCHSSVKVESGNFTLEHVVFSGILMPEEIFMFGDEYSFDPKELRTFIDLLIEKKHPDFVTLGDRDGAAKS